MARKEDSKPDYLPLIVRARLHTGGKTVENLREQLKGQGFTKAQFEAMVRNANLLDGKEVYLSKWNWDNHKRWHLYNWDDAADETIMLALYEAEQYHPAAMDRYQNDFEAFKADWLAETYDPGCTYTFVEEEVEVLETLQEEVDNVDHEAVRRQVAAAKDAEYQKRRMKRQRRKQQQSKGSRYKKKFF